MLVHKFPGKPELTFPCFGGSFHKINDLDEVYDYIEDDDVQHITCATEIGVSKIDTTIICITYKRTIMTPTNTNIVECSYCNTKQKVLTIKPSAKLFIEDNSKTTVLPQSTPAHQDILNEIATDMTSETLLNSKPFNLMFNKFHTNT